MTTSNREPSNVVPLFPSAPKPVHYAEALSFVERLKPKGSGINHWAVKSTGKYEADAERGREIAWELLRFVGANMTYGNVTLLQSVIGDMMRNIQSEGRQRFNATELSFLDTFGKFAFAGARVVL